MAILKAQSNVRHELTFTARDVGAGAIAEELLIGRFKALVNQGDPIPKALGEHIIAMLDRRKRPAHRPVDVSKALRRIAIGSWVEGLKARGMKRTEAIERTCKDFAVEPEYASTAHSYFMRLAGIASRRGKARRK
jgi:hypothetical protein